MVLSATTGSTSRQAGRGSRGTGGRILVQERETNNDVPILGQGLVLPDADGTLTQAFHDTLSRGMSHRTRRDYRSRIDRIIVYWRENFHDYYEVGVRTVTEEEKADVNRYYFERTEDFIYEGMNPQPVVYFLLATEPGKKRGQLNLLLIGKSIVMQSCGVPRWLVNCCQRSSISM